MRVTHVGGPTVLVEVAGWRILSDPTFDPPGKTYDFGFGTHSTKLRGPSVQARDLGPIDVVLLSHDNHGDNLDEQGRALLPGAELVVTTSLAASRLGVPARGLDAGETTVVDDDGRRPSLEGQADGVLWITGDSVLYGGLRDTARRLRVDVAVLHLGEVQFPITGPIRYSMTAADGVDLCEILRPRVAIPVHYEGWSHFHEGRGAVDAAVAAAPPDVRERVRILPIGEPVDLGG